MDKGKPKKKLRLTDYGKYSAFAFQMGLTIALGVWGGVKLDEYFGLEKFPAFTVFLSIFSIVISIYFLVKDLNKK